MAQTAKRLPAMWETRVRSLGWEHPLEKGMATYSSILTWRIPWTEDTSELQCMGLQSVQRNRATNVAHTHTHTHKTRNKKLRRGNRTLKPSLSLPPRIQKYAFSDLFYDSNVYSRSSLRRVGERCLTKNYNLAKLSHVLVASSK